MAGEIRISPRERAVLNAIIEMYIDTGEPVASQAIARQLGNRDGMSSATIRNVMASLGEAGLLDQPHTSAGAELDVVLPIVNAPFRFYYAYNYLRLNQTVNGYPGGYYLSDAVKNSLPPGVLQAQVAPELQNLLLEQQQHIPASLLEPKHTFRFTVGKTF